jgi:DNA-binding SARP family transcriptional activator
MPEPCLMVIDDFQYVANTASILNLMDWFVEHLPRSLHVIFSTRAPIDFPSLHRWIAKGTVLILSKNDLVFTPEEIEDLFRSQYHIELSPEDVNQLYQSTEGWIIGLQMIWQTMKNNPHESLSQILEESNESRTNLFAYLAEEVLENQEPRIRDFLLKTSILSYLDADTCDFLLDIQDSNDLLSFLYHSGLFLEQMRPGVYRYHHIFKEFLESRLDKTPAVARDLHRKIASYYTAHQDWEGAISHLLIVKDYSQINLLLESVGESFIRTNRHESVQYWVSHFHVELRPSYPYINYLAGEVNRYMGKFELALEDYRTAQRGYQLAGNSWGVSLALRSQAQVYLDTLRPINASQLLQQALILLDPVEHRQEMSALLTQLAENEVNQGEPVLAEENLKRAREIAHEKSEENEYIQARLYLRTGRLQEGIELIRKLEPPLKPGTFTRPQRFHRESSLLLSLFYAFTGELDKSLEYAQQGIEVGQHFHSIFIRSVAYMRLGHALQLRRSFDLDQSELRKIVSYYEEAIKSVDIARIHVEPLWGLCRLMGFSGNLTEARQVAENALAIAHSAGDQWIGMLVRISLGASLALAGEYESANQELTIAESTAVRINDNLAQSAALLWLSFCAFHQGFQSSFCIYMEQALALIKNHDYQFLFKRSTMLGSDRPEDFIPLLLEARKQHVQAEFILQVLTEMGLEQLEYHPGYTLRIQTFGAFNVWLGRNELSNADWKREKARQLLQVLVGNYGKWLSRDQITVILWPDADPKTASNNLKVCLSTLNQVLEPKRSHNEIPYFILRQSDRYMLNPHAGIIIDASQFDEWSHTSDLNLWAEAMKLYRGRYFDNEPVQEYFVFEEQYYHELYLHLMDKLILHFLEKNAFNQALDYARTLLNRDPLWEPGYRSMMQIYACMGDHDMVLQSYQQCQEVLYRQLGSSVSAETRALAERLLNNET